VAGALDGIRVIDVTSVLMAPLATRMLADHGADVVKIEQLGGDAMRRGRPGRNPGMPGILLDLFRNTRSVALDIRSTDGLEAARRMVDGADVFVTNVRAGGLDRLGLAPDVVRSRNPGLVYCWATGFGSDGPYAGRAAYDDVIQAGSGQAWLGGQLHGEPEYVPALIADKVGGLTIAQAVLAALLHRERTGQGQLVEVPMFETMVAFNLIEHARGHALDPPIGDFGYARLFTLARRPFPTADGWICILPYDERQWRDFFTFADRPELADRAAAKDQHSRIDDVEEVCGLVAEVTPDHTTAVWLSFCADRSIAAMAVNDLSTIQEDEHVDAVGLIETRTHPTEGPYRYVRDPVRYTATDTGLRRPAPRLGEHTDEVLAEVGYSAAEVADLRARGVAVVPAD